jgi:4-diphosphocytidyl-2C-methyl-D-erythritol kinase
MDTAEVYGNWDRLAEPGGPEIPGHDVPPELRGFGPLANDLTPAAVGLVPELGDWIADVSKRWGTTAALSGSGPALFGLFPTRAEAADAAASIPGVRAARGCSPTDAGRREIPVPDRD